ncbi:gamma-secretase subunit pen-2 [Bombyx mandarina]|uniref:Gamma-secretase subunit PEN-2 n=2 Tax=Bombyx TaxID=7090 RepID=Q2F5X1_BOMMO|nr:presenilin enhancer [Bombyx mori]XP_028034939.1 gamma-secretase subunit pen-2 [Bombyx mandarina]ABD36246.1 presenilin enhancer [Bombyx mori]
MDLSKLPNDMKLQLCKSYFKVGCLFLPFVWAVNVCWFFRDAFIKPAYDEQKLIKKFVIMSAIGAFVWAVILVTWITVYQTNRVSWGATGDALSFIVPLGRA